MELIAFYRFVAVWTGIAVILIPILLQITPPYGRHSRRGWGPMIPNRIGWIVMELPALLVLLIFAFSGPELQWPYDYFFVFLWSLHYVNRSLIYPFRIKTHGKKMPVSVAVMAIVFNTINGFLNGYYFGHMPHEYASDWHLEPRFIVGIMLFATGIFVNLRSDNLLISLRNNHSGTYQIPKGSLFRYVSCPNFLGEIMEWLGFALMVWSLPALSFFVWTAANLIPRALDHHRWYRRTFSDYPPERKALVPFLI